MAGPHHTTSQAGRLLAHLAAASSCMGWGAEVGASSHHLTFQNCPQQSEPKVPRQKASQQSLAQGPGGSEAEGGAPGRCSPGGPKKEEEVVPPPWLAASPFPEPRLVGSQAQSLPGCAPTHLRGGPTCSLGVPTRPSLSTAPYVATQLLSFPDMWMGGKGEECGSEAQANSGKSVHLAPRWLCGGDPKQSTGKHLAEGPRSDRSASLPALIHCASVSPCVSSGRGSGK